MYLDRTSIWALAYQTVGGAVIIPLYYLAYTRVSARKDFWSPASRQIPASYAKALLPSLVIGYLLPTILIYLPFADSDLSLTQGLIALWQLSPLIVNMLLFVISAVYGINERSNSKNDDDVSKPLNDDIKYLDRVYLTCFIVSAVAHIGTILVCLLSTHPQHSFMHALVLRPTSNQMPWGECIHYIFQIDYWVIFAAALGASYLTLWDLKTMGGKTDFSLLRAAVGMVLSVICVGPAATVAGVWYIREHAWVRKDKK